MTSMLARASRLPLNPIEPHEKGTITGHQHRRGQPKMITTLEISAPRHVGTNRSQREKFFKRGCLITKRKAWAGFHQHGMTLREYTIAL